MQLFLNFILLKALIIRFIHFKSDSKALQNYLLGLLTNVWNLLMRQAPQNNTIVEIIFQLHYL
jgi:hypothetical protein